MLIKFRVVATSMLIALSFFYLTACSKANSSNSHALIFNKLDEISIQLQRNADELALLKAEVTGVKAGVSFLEANAIPCTLERLNAGECGDYNQPVDLTVSLCSSRAAEAQVAADFQINNNNSLSLGVGWPNGIDGQLVRTVDFPGIPGLGAIGASVASPGFVLYGAPFPNLQAGVGASGSLGLDACIEIPISLGDVSSSEIKTLMEEFQQQGRNLQMKMVGMANSAMNMSLDKMNDSLTAMEVVQSKDQSELADINLSDPLKIFERGRAYGSLIDVLPIGDKVQQVLDKPEILSSSMSQEIQESGRLDRDTYCNYFQDDPSAPLLLKKTTKNICVPIKEALGFNSLKNKLDRISSIPTRAQIKDDICSLVDGVIIGSGKCP